MQQWKNGTVLNWAGTELELKLFCELVWIGIRLV
jgi:hypothetical protein